MAEQKPVAGSVVHVELLSKDPEATKKFFSQVFGWKFDDVPRMDYAMFQAPAAPNGGLRKPQGSEMPGTMNFIMVENLDQSISKITKAGGKIVMPKQEVAGWGWSAAFQAPGGVVQAVWQATPPPKR